MKSRDVYVIKEFLNGQDYLTATCTRHKVKVYGFIVRIALESFHSIIMHIAA